MLTSDYRKLLPTACFECVVDIVGWTDLEAGGPYGSVNVGVHSTHLALWRRSFRQRIARALTAVRADDPEGYLDFRSREEIDLFIEALREARDVAFPSA